MRAFALALLALVGCATADHPSGFSHGEVDAGAGLEGCPHE